MEFFTSTSSMTKMTGSKIISRVMEPGRILVMDTTKVKILKHAGYYASGIAI